MESLYFAATLNVLSALILWARYSYAKPSAYFWSGLWITSFISSLISVAVVTGEMEGALFSLLGGVALGFLVRFYIPIISLFGVGLLVARFTVPVAILIFVNQKIQQVELGILLWGCIYVFQLICLLIAVFYMLCRVLEDLPRFTINFPKRDAALQKISMADGRWNPLISIHVPCYAEPPALVIATLSAVANLEYNNFEVLVVDNNTKDPELWKPVEKFCTKLGQRFCFFHVDPLAGAKAGAINFALRHSNVDAEIVLIIDADYIVDPAFIRRYIALFEDEKTGFVQTSHDYREWRGNPFLSGVYHHYLIGHKTVHPALNEYGAGYLVGTVCMVRRHLIEELGGWAEWALTEDLELAMRIMAKGYTGHVFSDTWGKGLIPETLDGIKKQQFRWWAGATQEFRVNWRRYLGLTNEKMTVAQRSLRLYTTFKDCIGACAFLVDISFFLVCVFLVSSSQVLQIPHGFLGLIGAAVVVKFLEIWIGVRELGSNEVRDYFMTLMLKGALRWVGVKAFILPLFKLQISWVRTNKFKQSGNFLRGVKSSSVEILIGLIYLLCALFLVPFAHFVEFDLVALVSIWFFIQGGSFFCTLVMAIVSESALDQERLELAKVTDSEV
ncbi:glycosyltransferase [Pseudomonas sp. D2-30]|uniref:glycosyltransferase n=1 Tax=unclassified Pseudomonas TaxID=196821 RepID=UPI003DA85275